MEYTDAIGRSGIRIRGSSEIYKISSGIIVSRKCFKCKKFKPIHEFGLRTSGRDAGYYDSNCWDCEIKRRALYSENNSGARKFVRDKDGIIKWRCSICHDFYYEFEFWKDKVNELRSPCRYCTRKQAKQQREKRKRIKEMAKWKNVGGVWVNEKGLSISINKEAFDALPVDAKGNVKLFGFTNEAKEGQQPDYKVSVKSEA